ncbi:GNAT family N-acetyltransferase [Helicobacter sp. 11S03491-1]|uniref:GNAT family N-acetyltransferase n=1 Tax=Helicobacter sp. 11S03491-1 TaxID=1476196 RepID=UPI000BA6ED1A|nr:GNAT family N-acetyltransferase [Helicobacter sp. 11S03491-1]PAF42242.1 hypothetical protein BKH45_04670 [Helicobacter sp. 11S03491-1]
MPDFKQARTQSQIQAIHTLAQIIWKEHYASILTQKQIQYMLDKFQSFEAIKQQINQGYQYFQILDNTKPVGYFAFIQRVDEIAVQKSHQVQTNAIFLSKLYIEKTYRQQGIAKSIIIFLKKMAQNLEIYHIWLTVNKQNFHSIEAYKKLGFIIYREDCTDIAKGYKMDDYYMKIDFSPIK